jgi:ABC-type Mn2+/Zn2+ transport system permease subunit
MILLIIIYTAVALLNIPGLVRKKHWKDLTAFCVIYAISLTVSVLFVMDVPLPSPMRALHHLFSDILGLKYPPS